MENYNPPPGRPRSTPPTPGLVPPAPERKPGENWRSYNSRVQAHRRQHDPVLREQHARRLSEGLRSGHAKQHKIMADACDALNQTETRGRWYTLPMLERVTGWAQSTCSKYLAVHAIERVGIGRYYRSLLPTDKAPVVGLKPREQAARAPAPPAPVAAKPRIGRMTIEISPDEVEGLLREALGKPDIKFEWDRRAIIAREE